MNVDIVFYNKILRAYVLIELKTTKLTPGKEQLIAQEEAVLKNWHEKNDGSAHE